jgi:hypothetical protein
MNDSIKINYTIGFYWPNGAIGTYKIDNSEVFQDTIEDAKETLEYVKKQLPEKDWRIFQLIQLLHDK